MPGGPARSGVEYPLVIDAGTQEVLHPVRAQIPAASVVAQQL
jgi:hypothetical protein